MESTCRHATTREAHRNELAEDYVEAILLLVEADGDARLTELSRYFGVTHPTVSKVLKRLEKDGLVVVEAYRGITLTEAGLKLATACRSRHEVVLRFLTSFGLTEAQAELDAEGIEHHASPELLALMKKYSG
jgi:DtxR family manganese transport transcriptional regulator